MFAGPSIAGEWYIDVIAEIQPRESRHNVKAVTTRQQNVQIDYYL